MKRIARHPDSDQAWTEAVLGEEPLIHPNCRIRDCSLGAYTEIGPNCELTDCVIGDYTYLAGGCDCIHATIGCFCSIATAVRLNPGQHPMDRPAQHHCTYRRARYGLGADDADFFAWRRSRPCLVGNDVWIGHAALVMGGVRVGDGAVVGSLAVVTRDVDDFAVVAGVPARPLRLRLDPERRALLKRAPWWNWDHDTLRRRIDDLCGWDAWGV